MTVQPTNPLFGRQPQRPGKVTIDTLIAYAAELNTKNFVVASGKPYFVGVRTLNDGTSQHFLDRK